MEMRYGDGRVDRQPVWDVDINVELEKEECHKQEETGLSVLIYITSKSDYRLRRHSPIQPHSSKLSHHHYHHFASSRKRLRLRLPLTSMMR